MNELENPCLSLNTEEIGEDSFGREDIKALLSAMIPNRETDSVLGIPLYRFLALTGPHGSGKHNLLAYLTDLALGSGFTCAKLRLPALSENDEAALTARLTELGEESDLFLVAEGLCAVPSDRLEELLFPVVKSTLMHSHSLLLAFVTDGADEVPACLMKEGCSVFSVRMPNDYDRFSYICGRIADVPEAVAAAFQEKAYGMNYYQLSSAVDALQLQIKSKVLNGSSAENAVDSMRPNQVRSTLELLVSYAVPAPPAPSPISELSASVLEATQRVVSGMERLVIDLTERFPKDIHVPKDESHVSDTSEGQYVKKEYSLDMDPTQLLDSLQMLYESPAMPDRSTYLPETSSIEPEAAE